MTCTVCERRPACVIFPADRPNETATAWCAVCWAELYACLQFWPKKAETSR
jgi:hypothetical protein